MKVWEIGGFIAGGVLVLFGAAALYLGINGYRTVGNELDKEYIVGGSDMAPADPGGGAGGRASGEHRAAVLLCR